MSAYAAMVDRMDQSLGRLVAALKRLDRFEDTLILFLSDNGGCAEFMAEDGWAQFFPDETHDGRKITMGNVPNLRPGDGLTFQSYDKPWANVSNAPFRQFKHYVHEGGISTPLIAHWPKADRSGAAGSRTLSRRRCLADDPGGDRLFLPNRAWRSRTSAPAGREFLEPPMRPGLVPTAADLLRARRQLRHPIGQFQTGQAVRSRLGAL